MEYAVSIRKLNVRYGNNHVIKDLDLDVPKNVVFALMGPSGCGKSTLLRTINRLIELNESSEVEGVVEVFGQDIYSPGVDPKEIRKHIGMVFQYPNPFPHLTIYDNVAIGLKLNRMLRSKAELNERVEWALKKAALWEEVKDRLNDYPTQLSGGQRQRLVIARTLAMKPRLILMDEPTANIDPVGTQRIEELIVELKREYTIIIVTHSPGQAGRVSDWVGFMYLGRLIEVGMTKDIFENPKNELTEKYLTGGLG